ncbi:hypothetical protein SAMN05216553_115208 [Lentzea fradiae]|uniref:Uncharacterized protein n=1 Tax=Lentzea fradiae TaxID=200378 RepID=A0A1G7ZJ75_9PSEU|nr:hypothetical protein [Lentzea fradiae]SDH08665.1 hypothetical protein SAMN05216553_115208 [Lentzea fradiae]
MVREDDLRATFSALHAEDAPPRAVTAADVIRRGRTVRTRRRTIAVAGTGLATVAVVGVALAVLPPAASPEQLDPGPSTTTTSQVPSTTPPPSPNSVETTPSRTLPVTVTPPSIPVTNNPVPPVASAPPETTTTEVGRPGASTQTTPATSR